MTRAIASVDGVKDVEVSFEDKRAQVKSTRCDDAMAGEITKSLSSAGYGGEVVSTAPKS